jgi:hypothetical protein
MDETRLSQGAGPSDDATLRVVLATGALFTTVPTTLTQSTVAAVAANDAVAQTVASVDATRHAISLYNNSDKNIFVKLGASASSTDFSFILTPSQHYDLPYRYVGLITARWAAGPVGNLLTTIIRE